MTSTARKLTQENTLPRCLHDTANISPAKFCTIGSKTFYPIFVNAENKKAEPGRTVTT